LIKEHGDRDGMITLGDKDGKRTHTYGRVIHCVIRSGDP